MLGVPRQWNEVMVVSWPPCWVPVQLHAGSLGDLLPHQLGYPLGCDLSTRHKVAIYFSAHPAMASCFPIQLLQWLTEVLHRNSAGVCANPDTIGWHHRGPTPCAHWHHPNNYDRLWMRQ